MDRPDIPGQFAELIDECRSLIASSGVLAEESLPVAAEPLPSLLEQCRAMTQEAEADTAPVRTLHHFACTGGTLILKCLAAMPNTLTISEVEPHSRLIPLEKRRFSPTDWITLVRASNRQPDDELVESLFQAGLETLYQDCKLRGLHLVLRDHAHSHYCLGEQVREEKNLRALLSTRPGTLSAVTVRHPLDSFLSLHQNKWLHFEPSTLEEYSRRYHRFLDDHDDLARFHYEAFVDDPDAEMARLCDTLELVFNPDFRHLFGQFRFSGDSGRSSPIIGRRARRLVPDDIGKALSESKAYLALCERLGYDAERP